MLDQEWSRSRFWLCHFLHNRHDRPPLRWDGARPMSAANLAALAHWCTHEQAALADPLRPVIGRAARRYANDPAYVQCLRLFVKERHYHASLLARIMGQHGISLGPRQPMSRRERWLLTILGVRFAVAMLLLGQVLRSQLLQRLRAVTDDPATLDVLGQIDRDVQAHLAFCSERLTQEFADFNFIRRNLRRLRLRGMMLALATAAAWRQRRLIHLSGLSCTAFVRTAYRRFRSLLEQMVPYHREALLAALLRQREHPYAQPPR